MQLTLCVIGSGISKLLFDWYVLVLVLHNFLSVQNNKRHRFCFVLKHSPRGISV